MLKVRLHLLAVDSYSFKLLQLKKQLTITTRNSGIDCKTNGKPFPVKTNSHINGHQSLMNITIRTP